MFMQEHLLMFIVYNSIRIFSSYMDYEHRVYSHIQTISTQRNLPVTYRSINSSYQAEI